MNILSVKGSEFRCNDTSFNGANLSVLGWRKDPIILKKKWRKVSFIKNYIKSI